MPHSLGVHVRIIGYVTGFLDLRNTKHRCKPIKLLHNVYQNLIIGFQAYFCAFINTLTAKSCSSTRTSKYTERINLRRNTKDVVLVHGLLIKKLLFSGSNALDCYKCDSKTACDADGLVATTCADTDDICTKRVGCK